MSAGNYNSSITKQQVLHQMKGSEPYWSNPKSSTGNCTICTVTQYKLTYLMNIRLKFEILIFSPAPETHFASIPMLGGANSTFVG